MQFVKLIFYCLNKLRSNYLKCVDVVKVGIKTTPRSLGLFLADTIYTRSIHWV